MVVAGGDGTVAPVAELAGGLGVPLGVIPGGTANDFVRASGLPLDPVEAAILAVTGTSLRRLELGRLSDGRPFVNCASAGLASVAARRAALLKPRLGTLAYAAGAVRAAIGAEPLRCLVRAGGETVFDGAAWQLIVAVTGAFGGGSAVGAADPSDGVLDVAVLPAGSRIGLARRAWGMKRGTIAEQRDVEHHRAPVIEVELPPGTEVNADGEVRERGLERVTVERRAYALVGRLILPRRDHAQPPAARLKRGVPAMMRSMSARSSTSLRSSRRHLVELVAVLDHQPRGRALGLVRQVLLLLVAQLARAVGDLAALRRDLARGDRGAHRVLVDHRARDVGTRLRSSDAPVVTAPNTISSATRPPSSIVM